MPSKYTVDGDVVIIRGRRFDGPSNVFQTEREARQYVEDRRGIEKRFVFAIIHRAYQYEVVRRYK